MVLKLPAPSQLRPELCTAAMLTFHAVQYLKRSVVIEMKLQTPIVSPLLSQKLSVFMQLVGNTTIPNAYKARQMANSLAVLRRAGAGDGMLVQGQAELMKLRQRRYSKGGPMMEEGRNWRQPKNSMKDTVYVILFNSRSLWSRCFFSVGSLWPSSYAKANNEYLHTSTISSTISSIVSSPYLYQIACRWYHDRNSMLVTVTIPPHRLGDILTRPYTKTAKRWMAMTGLLKTHSWRMVARMVEQAQRGWPWGINRKGQLARMRRKRETSMRMVSFSSRSEACLNSNICDLQVQSLAQHQKRGGSRLRVSSLLINITMKTQSSRFQMESSSTQERERRFSRRNSNNRSRSRSNDSSTSSLSKFYVKNVEQPSKTNICSPLLFKPTPNLADWTPPKRNPTPLKTFREKHMTLGKTELLRDQLQEIQNLKGELQRFDKYCKDKKGQLDRMGQQNKSLKEEIKKLQNELEVERRGSKNLKLQLGEVNNKLAHKEKMLSYLEQDQNSLKKVKSSIFQSRMCEFEKEREDLNSKIRQLQDIIETMKQSPSLHESRNIGEEQPDLMLLGKSFSSDDHIYTIEKQLYASRQESKKLEIQLRCQQRKFHREMEIYKQKKEKEYLDLKEKFEEFLKKYKLTMKKFATFQVKSLISAHRSNLAKNNSTESLAFSSDEEPTHSIIQ